MPIPETCSQQLTLHRVLIFERVMRTGAHRSDCPCSAELRSCTRGATATGLEVVLVHRAAAVAAGAEIIIA